ncbi:S28 family serine protease [Actinacidiphila oryziradicis]|uniref:Aminopeptidase n=1 Tax=Actinacidiphila oryziradicis TaxID=2571141 RepID=A0A4U0SUY3_9ACTN|nr:S28 family serine protease [Actinacidiphila oryziradicis]TKA13378.1 aminopeptidase [Actinacidiphila oryziradicis]
MRKAFRWLLSLVLLVGALGSGITASAATADEPDIKDRILAVAGMSLIHEKSVSGYRYFVLDYTQPVDHRHPSEGTFQQRLTILHKATDRPTVFFTSGYGLSTTASRSEPTRIIDGNQVSMEYRFFTPSRPYPADWSKLDIWQAAGDQHRVFQALKTIYSKKWIDTGGSKGGMTATYYRRFYPHDMDGTVAYVAPNDVVNNEDSAYTRFFKQVGTADCRTRLNAAQREALIRRDEIVARYQKYADSNGLTFTTVGSADKAYENVVLDLVWGFWQYHEESECADVPATTVSTDDLYTFIDTISGFDFYTDQGLDYYTPYYYQAGTQLGAPTFDTSYLKGLLRYPGIYQPRSYVPRSIPMKFQPSAMSDIDGWVRHHADQMLFVYGQNDPWGAEPFRLGKGSRDSYVFWAPGANHGANIAKLTDDDKAEATAEVLEWAGVAPAAVQADPGMAKPLTTYNAKLDEGDNQVLDRQRL